MKICVFGSGSPEIDRKYIENTEKLGRILGEKGNSLVFGGGRDGLMGAAARGFRIGGGKISSVIPGYFIKEDIEPLFLDADKVYVKKEIRSRLKKMLKLADAFVVAPGGIGTFEEIFEVLVSRQLCRHHKPIAFYDIDGYYTELFAMMDKAKNEKFLRSNCMDLFGVFVPGEEEKLCEYLVETRKKKKDRRTARTYG